MSETKSVNCSQCGAPLYFPQNIVEIKCPFCGSIETLKETSIVNAKLNGKVIDIGVANIDELHELEEKIGLAKKFQIKYASYKLLLETLGNNYDKFINEKQISIKGNNTNTYIIHINGYLEVYDKDNKKLRDGQLFRNGYPAADAIVTFIQYAKASSDKLDTLWGCSNIKLTGGQLTEQR